MRHWLGAKLVGVDQADRHLAQRASKWFWTFLSWEGAGENRQPRNVLIGVFSQPEARPHDGGHMTGP